MRSESPPPSKCPVDPTPRTANAASTSEASGFGDQMMRVARHAAAGGAWQVRGDRFVSDATQRADAKLSTYRTVSTIPKAATTPGECPVHGNQDQRGGDPAADASAMAAAASSNDQAANWEYPSEQMYFRAMQRKGWNPQADQMTMLVAIHNAVNEQTWQEVLQWESMHPTEQPPRLKHFMGKPRTYSPKARLLHLLRGAVLPFDRHDWIVEREDGRTVRYVIDYYSGQPEPDQPLSIYIDVRPALDSFSSVVDRVQWQFSQWFPSLIGNKSPTPALLKTAEGSDHPPSSSSPDSGPAVCPHAS